MKKYVVIEMRIENAGMKYAAGFEASKNDLNGETIIATFNTRKEANDFCKDYGYQKIA